MSRTFLSLSLWLAFATTGCFPFPTSLEETGLYSDLSAGVLADGVREYSPRFELWSDGATKRRFILLPDGETIDTSNMDFWTFPRGTKLFKEFTRSGVRIETRMLEKLDDGTWAMVAYLWNQEQSAATAVPEGTENAQGTDHDVPTIEDCTRCHEGVPDRVLGFSALQLAHDGDGVTLQQLVDESLLSEAPPDTTLPLPGDANTQAVLGYLHANCGSCHNATTGLDSPMRLFLPLNQLAAAADNTDTVRTTVDVDVFEVPEGAPNLAKLVVPGDPESSMLYLRLTTRGETWQMPPLGSESVDATAVTAVEQWINSL